MLAPCYANSDLDEPGQLDISLVGEDEIEKLRLAGSIAKKVSLFAGSLVKPGVTLDWIDKMTHEYALSLGYYPSCLGKDGFPKSISISVNEVVCHAIPDDTVLENGDIVKVDLVMYADGFHGDTCRTFPCGDVDEKGLRLIDVTEKCLDAAIAVCRPGQDFFQIGRTIQTLANKEGFNVVEDYCGHGIGRYMHMLPFVLHFDNQYGGKMMENQVFTIEPMLVEGKKDVFTWEDGWTVATVDHGRCAQFEHTIVIHRDGAEILTCSFCSTNN